jgi:hypothetical protein
LITYTYPAVVEKIYRNKQNPSAASGMIVFGNFGTRITISEGCPEVEKMILARVLLKKTIKKWIREGRELPEPTPVELIGVAERKIADYHPEILQVKVEI